MFWGAFTFGDLPFPLVVSTGELVFCDLHVEVSAGHTRGYGWTAVGLSADKNLKEILPYIFKYLINPRFKCLLLDLHFH